MNHSGDANKMVGETPRTDAAYFKPGATMYDLAGEMKRVERELNAANERIKQLEDARTVAAANSLANMLAYEDAVAKIKRLEDCAETAWGIIANVDSGNWQEQRADWREAATRWRDERFHPELSECKATEDKP